MVNDQNLSFEFIKSSLSLLVALATLGTGWLIGNRLTFRWNTRQKAKELQLGAAQSFYVAYGEFFAVWKLWNRLDKLCDAKEERKWELHKRAAAAEAIVEGLLVKVSSEINLTAEEIATLGRFRQGFQQLRQNIRSDKELGWKHSEHPEYAAFKSLACATASLLKREWPQKGPSPETAVRQLSEITSYTWERFWFDETKHSIGHK